MENDIGVRLSGTIVKAFVHVEVDPIVTVDEAEIFTGGLCDTEVPCVAETAVRLHQSDDLARVFAGVTIDDGLAVIGRAVIDDENLDVLQGLIDEGVEAASEIRF